MTMQQRLAEPAADEHETLGQRLRRLRLATGCTVGEIAAAAGIREDDLAAVEIDRLPRINPSQWLDRLARVYGVGLDELVP